MISPEQEPQELQEPQEPPETQELQENVKIPPPVYCAKCYHSFCIPQECEDSSSDSEIESDSESDDDSVSPIFREDPEDIEEMFLDEITDYMKNNPLVIWKSSFEKELIKQISSGFFEEWLEDDLCEEYDLPQIQEWVKSMIAYYFSTESEMPPRQGGVPLDITPLRRTLLIHKLRVLANNPAPPQRTQEWYETRYGLLTASNVWKALGTESQQNQLIMEKCIPFDKFKEDCARHGNLSSDNPMAWGQKYEPISALIYEKKNRTQLGEYGCIVHPEWQFLGASPDGINVDPESPVYGRMIEIKNIVNRDIDGIPLDAYWVQMQIQMEVADLDECDFVETRIKEYASREEFFESTNPYKGVVLTFVPRITIESTMRNNSMITTMGVAKKSFYEYFFLDSNPDVNVNEWIQSMKDLHKDYVVANTGYWGLDQYSCVLVKRNRIWFENAIPYIERIWQIIEKERITGCEHRAPKKREPKDTKVHSDPKVQADPSKLCIDIKDHGINVIKHESSE
jgi:putative phage-type endonuclease